MSADAHKSRVFIVAITCTGSMAFPGLFLVSSTHKFSPLAISPLRDPNLLPFFFRTPL
jgi:hypothetical protein